MSILTYTYGTTPPVIIRERLDAMGEPFTAQLVGATGEMVETLVNQGIDSHLEACFLPDRGDAFEWVAGTPRRARHLSCVVSPESMIVLLRRLNELSETECAEAEDAMSLRSNILGLLDIEEV